MGNPWTKIPANKTPSSTLVDEKFWSYLNPGDKVLDIGCSWGRIVLDAIRKGFKVWGIDINRNEVDDLKKRVNKTVNIQYGNILDIDLKLKFNGILLQGVLSTMKKSDRSRCLKKVKTLLADGSYVHISEFKINDKEKIRYDQDFPITKECGTLSVKDGGKELYQSHCFTEEEITSLISESGLKIVSVKNGIFTSYHGNKKPGIMIIATK